MLDDFREQANSSPFFDETDNAEFSDTSTEIRRQFLGMTPAQRFVIAVLLLVITLLLSSFCLIVTEKIVLPFL